jgi:hypothetical protein
LYEVGRFLDQPVAEYWVLGQLQGGVAVFALVAAFFMARKGRRWAALFSAVVSLYLLGESFAANTQYFPPLSLRHALGLPALVGLLYQVARLRRDKI